MTRLAVNPGDKYGLLTVVSYAGRDKNDYASYLCNCDCGQSTITRGTSLVRGVAKSCGCLRVTTKKNHVGGKKEDLTGRVFGRLTVIGDSKQRRRREILWDCKCSCGNSHLTTSTMLKRGYAVSCGCYVKDKNAEKIKDLTGKRFGLLTAIEKTKDRSAGYVVWRCRCDCGAETTARSNALLFGEVASCGHTHYGAHGKELMKGDAFGWLTAIKKVGSQRWLFECRCGGKRIARGTDARNGKVVSCGCAIKRKGREPLMPKKAREYSAALAHARRVRIGVGRFTADEIRSLHERQKGRCAICGSRLGGLYHRDHIQPVSRGGDNTIKNIQLTCPRCNLKKGSKDPFDFAAQRGMLL